jgi:hypothetical protein
LFLFKNITFLISGDSLSTVEVFNPLTGRWEVAEAMSILRSRVGVSVLNNKLYAFGGYNGVERLSSVEVFDPATKSWNIVSPMHRKRRLIYFNYYELWLILVLPIKLVNLNINTIF